MRFYPRLLLATLLALVAANPAAAAGRREVCATGTPAESLVCRFYQRLLEMRPAGLPTKRQQSKLAPFLSRRLLELFDRARAEQQDFARRFPGEKPPFADGFLFASLFEGPDRFEVLGGDPRPATIHVTVRFGYQDAPSWEDVVVVTRQGSAYVIDDVLFGGSGEFNPPGSLAESLAARDD